MNIKLSHHLANISISSLPIIVMIILLGITGCATEGIGGSNYTRSQARKAHRILRGKVTGIRPVSIEGTRSGIGTMAGVALGGLGGSEIGGGIGSTAAALGGAILGGIVGQAAEQVVTKQTGIEITVELDNGDEIAIVQGADEDFRIGDRVRVIRGGGVDRVTR